MHVRWRHIDILSPRFPSPLAFHLPSILLDRWDPAKIDGTRLRLMIPPWRSTIPVQSRTFFCFPSPLAFHLPSILLDRWDPAKIDGTRRKKKNFLAWRDSNCGPPDPQSPMLTARPLGIPIKKKKLIEESNLLYFGLSTIIFPSFLVSSRKSRKYCSRTLLATYFRELEKVLVLVLNFGN
jgi:hypothetical protein